jgi:DNA gyrase subunit A
VIGATGRDTLYLFDTKGLGTAIAVHTLPECDNHKDGVPIAAVAPFDAETEVVAGIALPPKRTGKDLKEGYLIFGTATGMVKKTNLDAFPGPSAKTFRAIKVAKSDELRWVHLTSGKEDLCLVTNAGMAIRFNETDVRPMGLSAKGVYGIRIDDAKTRVVSMCVIAPRSDLLLVTENGLAKRTLLSKFPSQGRHGKGVLAWKSGEDVRLAGAVLGRAKDRAVAHLKKGAARSIRFSDAPKRLRNASGKKLFDVKKSNRVTLLTPVIHRPDFDS